MVNGMAIKEHESWKPDRPISRGATAFHNAVIDASWNHECLDELIDMTKKNVHDNDVLVDFGAGTGTSAIRILENIKAKIKLWLVDNSPAWLGKAYGFLSDNPNVSFFVLEKKCNSIRDYWKIFCRPGHVCKYRTPNTKSEGNF